MWHVYHQGHHGSALVALKSTVNTEMYNLYTQPIPGYHFFCFAYPEMASSFPGG